jgi:hypothetical protein
MEEIRNKLNELLNLLRNSDETFYANQIEDVLAGSDNDLREYIASNELWGGAGSIADQAGIENKELRRRIEAVLAELGEIQIKTGIINVRTEMWTFTFRKWRKEKI